MYVGLKVPYEAGFDQSKGPTHQVFSDCALKQLLVPGYQQVFAWIDLLIDFFFFFDLLINFFTGTHSQKCSICILFFLILSLFFIFLHRHPFSKVLLFFVFRLLLSRRFAHQILHSPVDCPCPENGFTLLPQFWLDILGIIPWQYVDCLHASVQVLKNFRVFRLEEFAKVVLTVSLSSQIP